jgi:hypothetical protein
MLAANFGDPVVMSKIIVDSLLDELASGEEIERISVINILRLLNAFEADALFAADQITILNLPDDLSELEQLQQFSSYERLGDALVTTKREISPDDSKADFVKAVSNGLKELIGGPPPARDTADIRRFLTVFSGALSP